MTELSDPPLLADAGPCASEGAGNLGATRLKEVAMKQRQSPAAKRRAQGKQIGDVLLVIAVGLALTTGFMINLWLGPGPQEVALAEPSAGRSDGADASDVSRLRKSYPDDTLVMTLRPSN